MLKELFQYIQWGLRIHFLFDNNDRRKGALIENLWNFQLTIMLPIPVNGTNFSALFLNSTLSFWILFESLGL